MQELKNMVAQRDEEYNEEEDEESCGGVSACKVHREKTSGVG